MNPSAPLLTTAIATAMPPSPTARSRRRFSRHLLYRHWNHFTGDKRSHLFVVDAETASLKTQAVRDLTPNDPHDVPPFSLEGGGGFAFAPDSKELAFTENLDSEPAISTNADIFTLDLTNPAAKPVKVSTSEGGDFNPAYSPDGKYLAWRSQRRAGYESDKFRLLRLRPSHKNRQRSAAEIRKLGGRVCMGDRFADTIYLVSGTKARVR